MITSVWIRTLPHKEQAETLYSPSPLPGTAPFGAPLVYFRLAGYSGVNPSALFDWTRTGDEDIHESLRALLPVGAGRHVGDADERPK